MLERQSSFHAIYLDKPLFHIDPKTLSCTCFIHNVSPQITKLDPKSFKCIFLGYSEYQDGYRCFAPNLGQYTVAIDVTFHEITLFSTPTSQRTSWTFQLH